MYSVDNLVVCLGDIDGHVGRYIIGYNGVHGRYCVGQCIWKKECY